MNEAEIPEGLHYERLSELRRRLFVDALFANGFRITDAMKYAGFRGKNLTYKGSALARRPDVQADIKARFAKLEQEDPRFASQAILHEIAETAYMKPHKDTLAQKVRALELLGKWRKLFVERTSIENPDGTPVRLGVLTTEERRAALLRELSN